MKERLGIALVILAFAGAPRKARAQGNAYAAPIGGRSALMGNTGVALGVDGAAPFLNPATIVRLDDQRFAFSVNFYEFSVNHFSNWHQPGQVDTTQFGNVSLSGTSLTSSGFSGLPSTLCLFFTLAKGSPDADARVANLDSWRQKLALCLGTTENQGVAFAAVPFSGTTSFGQTTQAQSLIQSWNRLNIGPSYSIALTHRLALGVSLHAVYTTESYLLNSSTLTSSANNSAVGSALGISGGGSSMDVASILGATYGWDRYTFGASVSVPSVHVLGSYTGVQHEDYEGGTSSGTASISNGTGTLSAGPPVRVAVGAGAEWPSLTLELDESLYIPSPSGFSAAVTGTTSALANGAVMTSSFASKLGVAKHVVVNTSVGAEYFLTRDFSVVGGLALNLSALAALAPASGVGNLVQERESTATLSAGVGSYSKTGNVLIGFQLGYGWGSSLAVDPYVTPNQLAVIDTQAYSALLILSGSTSLKSLGHAVEHIEKVISGAEKVAPPTTPPEKTALPPPASAPAGPPSSARVPPSPSSPP